LRSLTLPALAYWICTGRTLTYARAYASHSRTFALSLNAWFTSCLAFSLPLPLTAYIVAYDLIWFHCAAAFLVYGSWVARFSLSAVLSILRLEHWVAPCASRHTLASPVSCATDFTFTAIPGGLRFFLLLYARSLLGACVPRCHHRRSAALVEVAFYAPLPATMLPSPRMPTRTYCSVLYLCLPTPPLCSGYGYNDISPRCRFSACGCVFLTAAACLACHCVSCVHLYIRFLYYRFPVCVPLSLHTSTGRRISRTRAPAHLSVRAYLLRLRVCLLLNLSHAACPTRRLLRRTASLPNTSISRLLRRAIRLPYI